MALLNMDYRQLSRLAVLLSTFAIMFAVFALIYRVAPYQHLPWRFVWPGVLLAAVFNEVAKYCFIWYISHVGSMELQLAFGSLTAIMVLLMLFYVAGIGLVFGFEFNLALAEAKEAE